MAAGCHRRSREEYKFCNRLNTRINMAIQQKVINASQTEIYVGGVITSPKLPRQISTGSTRARFSRTARAPTTSAR